MYVVLQGKGYTFMSEEEAHVVKTPICEYLLYISRLVY